jgi:hypothetical protein
VPPTEEPPTPPPEPTANERGNVALALAEELTVFDGVTRAASFAIAADSMSLDVACTDPASTPAANGRLIAVLVHVTTGPDLAAVGGGPAVSAADFRFLAPDGVTLLEAGTPSAATCLPDTEEFPAGPIAPGQDLTGTVVLDVPAAAGTLVFAPGFLPVGGEWQYG